MKFKVPKLKDQFFQIYPKLRLILCDLDCYSQKRFGKEIIITSLIRKNDKGVHGYGRGADVRVEYVGWKRLIRYYTGKEIASILHCVNSKYIYDFRRPEYHTIIYHRVKGSTHHFHVQCWVR